LPVGEAAVHCDSISKLWGPARDATKVACPGLDFRL
jgi:hypothetical protein